LRMRMWHTWAIIFLPPILLFCHQYFLWCIHSYIPMLLFLCHVYICWCFWLGSCSDGYFYMKQTYVGGGASISAASNQPVCVHLRCLACSLCK
jgi:hypothetical protein